MIGAPLEVRRVELKKLAKDKRQAVYSQLSQCQLSRDAGHVRRNISRWGNKVTLPRDFLEPAFGGEFFCLQLSADVGEEMGWALEAGGRQT